MNSFSNLNPDPDSLKRLDQDRQNINGDPKHYYLPAQIGAFYILTYIFFSLGSQQYFYEVETIAATLDIVFEILTSLYDFICGMLLMSSGSGMSASFLDLLQFSS
jgi:hypothetical protein